MASNRHSNMFERRPILARADPPGTVLVRYDSIYVESDVMFALLMVGFSVTPLGLLLVFWNIFPQDRSIHPIYREAGVETEVQYAPSSQLKTLKHELLAGAASTR